MGIPIIHERAVADISEIAAWIARDQLQAALRFIEQAESAFNLLGKNPGLGPVLEPAIAEFSGLRFWPIKRFRNYLVIYRVIESSVEILRVLHGARDVERVFRLT